MLRDSPLLWQASNDRSGVCCPPYAFGLVLNGACYPVAV